MDDLLNYITSLVVISVLLEPNNLSDDVSNESSEDEDSDNIIIVFFAIQTRSSSLIESIMACYSSLLASL